MTDRCASFAQRFLVMRRCTDVFARIEGDRMEGEGEGECLLHTLCITLGIPKLKLKLAIGLLT